MSKRLTAHVFVKGTAIKCMSVYGLKLDDDGRIIIDND